MKHSQIVEIPDQELNDKLIPANDNYQQTSQSVESFEEGSILSQRDYTQPIKRNHLGLIVACGIAALVLVVVFIVPKLG
jgi:hypothetical protein